MSLVIEATAQSPARRENSPASALRNGRSVSRSVSILTIGQSVAAARRARQLLRASRVDRGPATSNAARRPDYAPEDFSSRLTDTYTRPLRLVANSTLPSIRANSV